MKTGTEAATCLQARRGDDYDSRRNPELNSISEIKNIAALRDAREKPPIILGIYEEAVGTLRALDHDGGSLIARIGPVTVVLPAELEADLSPHIGAKIGTLRTDSTERPYRVRVYR